MSNKEPQTVEVRRMERGSFHFTVRSSLFDILRFVPIPGDKHSTFQLPICAYPNVRAKTTRHHRVDERSRTSATVVPHDSNRDAPIVRATTLFRSVRDQ